MKIIKDIPNDIFKSLEDAYYEVESYKAVIPEFLKLPKEKIDYTLINTIREEYKKVLIDYHTKKIEFEFDFIKKEYPNAISWNLTFGDGKIEITLPDE